MKYLDIIKNGEYKSIGIYNSDARVKRVIDALINGKYYNCKNSL